MDKKELIKNLKEKLMSTYGPGAENIINRKVLSLMNSSAINELEPNNLDSFLENKRIKKLNRSIKRVNRDKLKSNSTLQYLQTNNVKLPLVGSERNVGFLPTKNFIFLFLK